MDKRILLAHGLLGSSFVYAVVIYILGISSLTQENIRLGSCIVIVLCTIIRYTLIFPSWKRRVSEEPTGTLQSPLCILGIALSESCIIYILIGSLILITSNISTEIETVYPLFIGGIAGVIGISNQLKNIFEVTPQEILFPLIPNKETQHIKDMLLRMLPYLSISTIGLVITLLLLFQ